MSVGTATVVMMMAQQPALGVVGQIGIVAKPFGLTKTMTIAVKLIISRPPPDIVAQN